MKIDECYRCVFGLCLVAFLLLTTGCAITPATRAKFAPAALHLAPGQGMLAVKVASNRPLSFFSAKWTMLRVTNLDRKESFTLNDRSDSSALHSLFVEPLPVGTYAIESVSYGGPGMISGFAPAANRFPTFKVAEGQLTQLGTLVYIRRHYPFSSLQFWWAQADSPFDREAVLRQLEPAVASQLNRLPVLGWNEEVVLTERKTVLSKLRQFTMRVNSPMRLDDGSVIFGESFGQLAIRTPAGAWRWMQTPTVLTIRSVYAINGGGILAGSDDDLLMLGNMDGRPWRLLPLPTKDASVIYIGRLPNTNRTVVVLQTRDQFIAYSTDFAQPLRWKEEFSRPRMLFLNPVYDSQGVVLSDNGRLFLITGGTETKREVVAYDSATRTWKTTQLSEKGAPLRWVVLPGTGLLGQFKGIPLTGMYFATSVDDGRTWRKRGALNWAENSVLFVSGNTGYAVRTDSRPLFDIEKFVLSLWRTDDGGDTWKKVGPTPAIHGKLLALGGPEELGYASSNGGFFVSPDGGQHWRLERQIP